jgi:hypothetical protein
LTLLEIVAQVAREMGFPVPTAVVSSSDPQVQQFYAIVNRLGIDLTRQFDWQALDTEYVMRTVAYGRSATMTQGSAVLTMTDTTGLSAQFGVTGVGIVPFAQIKSVDSATQVTLTMPALSTGTGTLQFSQVQYSLPADWKKQIPQTEWDRTNRWPLMGPVSAQDWQSFKSGIVYAGPRERFRILGTAITLNPPPPDGLLFAFEYISKSFVRDASGLPKASFTADTDTCIFDDSLMVTGLEAKFKQKKGLDATFEVAEFTNLLEQCKAQDKSAPKLSLSPWGGSVLLSPDNIRDGNWPG